MALDGINELKWLSSKYRYEMLHTKTCLKKFDVRVIPNPGGLFPDPPPATIQPPILLWYDD